MSEISNSGQARILEMYPAEDGSIDVVIDSDTTGLDVMATLEFLQPDVEARDRYVLALLHKAANLGFFSYMEFEVDDSSAEITDQVYVKQLLQFGEDPGVYDLISAFSAVYEPERIAQKLQELAVGLIDAGVFTNTKLKCTQHNELLTAQPHEIDQEMDWMKERYLGSDGDF